MKSATFIPPKDWYSRIAPTNSPADHLTRLGQVNDPTTERMGGITGMAGLFANASDLGTFAQCLLNGGKIQDSHYLLGPLTILKMTTAQTPPAIKNLRGLGWDIDSQFSNRGVLLSKESFGHSGWTEHLFGSPGTQTWIIILTSRTHPTPAGTNQLISDRVAIANIVAGSLIDIDTSHLENTSPGELSRAYTQHEPGPTQ